MDAAERRAIIREAAAEATRQVTLLVFTMLFAGVGTLALLRGLRLQEPDLYLVAAVLFLMAPAMHWASRRKARLTA